jgi:DNA end-binding protein Ku
VPRSLWTGAISFGLVNVPVRLYSAVSEHKLHFHLVHEKDSSPIGYQKICKAEEKPVPEQEIVKAFEYRKGKYVFMSDADFEAARVEGYKSIEITDFVPHEEIDPIFFAHTYYVGPQQGAEKVYSLLVRAMEDSGLTAIVKFVMRDRQHLGALRVREGVIMLEELYFADEIKPITEIKAQKTPVSERELEMAAQLVNSFAGAWKPQKYKDTYREQLLAAITAKQKGQQIHRAPEVEDEEPADLLEALRASIERTKNGRKRRTGRPKRSRPGATGGSDDELEGLTKGELDQRAKKAGVEGRSKMTKDELVKALAHNG